MSYDNYTVTINTSRANESSLCIKFLRNGKTDAMMSEPFNLTVKNNCNFNAKPIKDLTRYIYYDGQSFETLF